MLAQLTSLLTVAMIVLAAGGLGWPLVRKLEVEPGDGLARLVWSVAIGLVLAAGALAGLCLCGPPQTMLVVVMTLAASGCAAVQLLHALIFDREPDDTPDGPWQEEGEPFASPMSPPRWIVHGIATLAIVACLGALVTAAAPPTAVAAAPHLRWAKSLLNEGMRGEWSQREPIAPVLMETWYLWALALDGPVAAQVLDWALGVLLALAAVLLARSIVGRSWAWPVGCVVALVPAVQQQMAIPGNGPALALLTTLALAAWWHAAIDGLSRGWLVVAGLMAGAALGVSPLGAALLVALAVSCAWIGWRHPQRRAILLPNAFAVLLVAAAVGAAWYAPWNWQYVSLPETFGRWQVARLGGSQYQLGILFPAALPGLLVARRLRGLGMVLAMALVYAALWHLTDAGAALLLPIVPLLAIATVWVWVETRRFPCFARRTVTAAMAGLVAVSTLVSLGRCREQLAVALGQETREQYLARHEPTWAAAEVSNLMYRREAHLLSEDPNAFWFNCRVTSEDDYRQQSGYDSRLNTPAELNRVLREAGFTHLLLAEPLGNVPPDLSPLARLVEAQWTAGDRKSLVNLLEYTAGAKRYRLVMVANAER